MRVGKPKPKDREAVLAMGPMLESMVNHSFSTIGPLLEAEVRERTSGRGEEAELPEAAARYLSEPVSAA
jgi:hypothetical protein